jgi:hypothetical protein
MKTVVITSGDMPTPELARAADCILTLELDEGQQPVRFEVVKHRTGDTGVFIDKDKLGQYVDEQLNP